MNVVVSNCPEDHLLAALQSWATLSSFLWDTGVGNLGWDLIDKMVNEAILVKHRPILFQLHLAQAMDQADCKLHNLIKWMGMLALLVAAVWSDKYMLAKKKPHLMRQPDIMELGEGVCRVTAKYIDHMDSNDKSMLIKGTTSFHYNQSMFLAVLDSNYTWADRAPWP